MTRHILLLTFVAWGHLRPECNLAFRLASRYPDLTVSLIADADFASKAQDEVNRIAGEKDKEVAARIRVISAGCALRGVTPQLMAALGSLNPKDFRTPSEESTSLVLRVCDDIMSCKSFKDDNDVAWEGVATKPSLMITDMFMADAALPVKEKYSLPTYMYWVGCAASFTRLYGPVAHGGQAEGYIELCDAIEADPERAKGRSFAEIAKQVFAASGRYPGGIVRVRGLKPFYEWEDFPQEFWIPGMYWSIGGVYPLIKQIDGLLVPSVEALDPEGMQGIRDWFSPDGSRQVLALGPQLPPYYLDATLTDGSETAAVSGSEVAISYQLKDMGSSSAADPSIVFLDEALAKHGANSVLYISFGTVMIPNLEYVKYLFEVLLELEEPVPFLFTMASPILTIPDDLKTRIVESGRGLTVPWAPQQSVFMHPATGFTLSHCGAGATFEALSQGMPLIAWPVAVDQTQNARWMSEVLDTAFELIQVRCALNQKKAYRGGPEGTEILYTEEAIKEEMKDVLKKSRGEEGKRKRANARTVRQTIHSARQPGGQVDADLEILNKAIA